MAKNKYSDLRNRAEHLLQECQGQTTIPNKNIEQLIQELTTNQLELELQNEDLQKYQTELEESRRQYIELYDCAPVGYFSFNIAGLITDVNQAGCLLLGLRKTALINRCFSRYIAQEYQLLFSQYRQQAFTTKQRQSFELKLLCWNQPSFYALIECKVIENQQTGMKQLLANVTDISEHKRLGDNLHQHRIKMASIDRMRSINELVYGMAQKQHYSLMLMDNYLFGCIRRIESQSYEIEEILQTLKKIATQSRALGEFVTSRKNMTSKSVFHYVALDINSLIKQTILLIAHEMLEFPITVQYEESNNSPMIKLDVFHMQQAILNIVRNALESMRDSNTQEPKLLIETAIQQNNMVEVTLFDNGPGLTQNVISSMFEPHFTTKSYGIGLGLTVSRAIIEKHGGELFASPNPAGGACFGFTLPCCSCQQ